MVGTVQGTTLAHFDHFENWPMLTVPLGSQGMSHVLSDEEFAHFEASDPFVHGLIMNVDTLLSSFK